MFSTFYTPCQQLSRRAYVMIATLVTLAMGFSVAYAQQLETEFISPIHVTDSQSVLFDEGLVEMSVDETLLQEMSVVAGDFIVRDFPINTYETIDLEVQQFFPYRGDIHEAYYAIDRNGNRVVRKRPIDITVKCFRGRVIGHPDSLVVFGLSKEMCNGFIEYGETRHVISTDPATGVIVVSDPLAEQPGLQLVREMMHEAAIKQGGGVGNFRGLDDDDNDIIPPPGCGQVTLSVVYGADFLALFGGPGSQAAAENYIVTLIGQVSEIFHRDGVIWVEYAVLQITDGTGIVDSAGDLATELCNFVEASVGALYPDPTQTGSAQSDGILILRTAATGSVIVGGVLSTQQSLGYFGGITTGINPVTPGGGQCPLNTALNAVGAASGLIGATDTTGYDTYIVAQALGTLCGASPTGATPGITALGAFGLAPPAPSGAGTQLFFDNCDGGAPAIPVPGTIMSSCILPPNSTMAANIDLRINTVNAIAMNALLTAPPTPLINGGLLVPAPIVTTAATQGGAPANCNQISVTWTADPAATTEYVFRNTVNVFNPGQLGGASLIAQQPAPAPQPYRDSNIAGGNQYFYWVASTNQCNIDDPYLIADQFNPDIMQPLPSLPNVPGVGTIGIIGNAPPPIEQVMATVYEDCDTITVTWDLTLPPPAGYPAPDPDTALIYRKDVDIPPVESDVPIATVNMTPTTYSDNDGALEQDKTYFYWITPQDSNCIATSELIVGASAAGILQPDISAESIRVGATNGTDCNGVLLSWIPETSLLGVGDIYQIWRADTRLNPQVLVQIGQVPAVTNTIPNTQYLDGSADAGVEYEYWVLAENECSTSLMALNGSLGISAKLTRPQGVQVIETDPADPTTPSCGDVEIRWNTVANADEYEIWRNDINDFFDTQNPPTSLGDTTDLSFVDSPPVAGQLYYYWVASVSRLCPDPTTIPLSTTVFGSATPPLIQPTNLIVSKGSLCDRILVQWDGSFDGTTYTISRSETDNFDSSVVVGSLDDLGYFHDPQDGNGQPDPLTGTTYYYWVVADNDCGTTSESDSDSGYLGSLLASPTGLDATEGSFCDGIQVSWIPRVLANSYRVYRDIDNDSDGAMLLSEELAPASTFDDVTAVPGVQYFYWVEAVTICSLGGDPVLGTPVAGLNGTLIGPSGVTASNGDNCGFVDLSWDEVPLASNYVVHRGDVDDFSDPGTFILDNTTSANYQDETVNDKQLYFYWVTTDTAFCVGADQSAGVTGWAMTDLVVVNNLAAGQGTECSGLIVTWDGAANILQYEVFRNDTGDTPVPGDSLGTSTEPIFVDQSAVTGENYYYFVQTETTCGPGEFSDESYGYLADPLTPPSFVGQSDSGNCNDITIGWLVVDGADDYSIYKSTSDLFSDSDLLAQNITTTQFTDVAVTAGQTFFYWVLANNACGLSGESSSAQAANTTLDNPSVVTTETGCSEVTVSWDSITDASGYSIYRTDTDVAPVPGGPNPGDVAIGNTFGVGATTYVDDTVVPQTLYYYWVVTDNVACQTLPGISTAGAAVAQPVAPGGLGSTDGDCGAVTVSWTDFAWDVTYHVYRNTTGIPPIPDEGVTAEGSVTASPFVDTLAEDDGTLYYYWVTAETACDGGTESGVGVRSEGMSAVADPLAPDSVTVTDGVACAAIDVQWAPVLGVDDYVIYRSESSDFVAAGVVGSVTQDQTVFTDATAADGVVYFYWVVGSNDCGESANVSLSDSGFTGTLVNPENILTTSECGGVSLVWDPVAGNNGYQVYRGTDPITPIDDLGFANTESFLDSPPDPKTPYYYFVTTHNGDCEGVTTVGQYGISMPEATAVQGVDADNVSCDMIELDWTAENWGATYTVWRNTDNVFGDPTAPTATPIGTTTDAVFTDGTLAANTQYYYWVTTDHATCGTSPASDVASAISEVPQIGGVAATVGTFCDFVEVSWTDLGQGTTYHVWRNTVDDPFNAEDVTLDVLNDGAATFSPYQDNSALDDGTEYYYWVTAEPDACPGEEGEYSDSMFGRRAPTPDAPSNVVATLGTTCASVDLQWSGESFADQYRIYRADNASAPWEDAVEIGTPVLPPLTVFTDNTASEAMEYTYWVVSETACGESDTVTGDGVLGYSGELANPVVATDTEQCGAVTMTWNEVTDASGYSIYRTDTDVAPVPGGPNPGDVAIGNTFGVGATTYVDDTVVPQTLYYYWVVTDNDVCQTLPGISTAGAAVAQPVAPDGLGSTNGDCGAVTVSWTDFAWDVTYHVYRNETGIPPTPDLGVTAIATVTASPFVDATALPDSTLYYYWVTAETACDGATESGVGVRSEGMSALADPLAPDSVTVTDGVACAAIDVQWAPVLGVDDYVIYRSESSDFVAAGVVGSVTQDQTVFTDATAADGVVYFYWVVGSNDCGESANVSLSDSGFTGTLVNPENILTTSECGGVSLVWDPVAGNNGYQVYRGTDPITPIDDLGFANTESFLDSPPDPKTPYYYFVTTHNGDCEGVTTVGQYGISMPEATAVQGVDADNVSCDMIELDWTAENWGATYTVWRNTDNVFGDPTAPTATPIGTTTDAVFTDGTLAANTQYYYWVTTDHATCGTSPASDVASAISEVPQIGGVAATVGTFCDFVEVSWTDLGQGTTYHVWRNTVDDPFNAEDVTLDVLNDGAATFSPYQDNSALDDGTEYFYWVTAEPDACAGEEGEYSVSMLGRRGNTPINPATVFVTQGTTCASVELQWSGEELVGQYVVYRADEANAAWADATEIGTVNSPLTNFADNTADAATQYTYWVTSETSCGEGTAIDGDGVLGYLGSLVGPGGVTATDGTNCGSIDLGWNTVQDALNYVVWRSVTADFNTSATIGNTSATTYQDSTNVDDKTIYYYWVTADSQFCPGDTQSESVSGWAMTDLAVVTGVVAGQGDQCEDLLVAWDPVENIIRYDIYRNDTGDEPIPGGADPNDAPIDTTTSAIFLDDTAVAGTPYYYWVRAVTSCGEGDDIGTFAIGYLADTLPQPVGIGQADPVNCTSILIEWQAVEGAVGYKVHRAVDDDFADSTYLEEVQGNSYSDTTVPEGQTHYYWVEATNACGDSPVSASAAGITASLGSPVITEISTGLCGVVEMSWDAVEGADEYHVYYSQNPSPSDPSEAIYLDETISTNFTDEAVLLDTPIYYWVLSVVDPEGINCVSFWGNNAMGQALAPTSPSYNLNASVNEFCNKIRLDWTSDNVGTTTHTVYRGDTNDPDDADLIGSTVETLFFDYGDVEEIIQGTTYFYWVKSSTSCEESDFSVGTHGWTQVDPVNPEFVNATDSGTTTFCNSVNVDWAADPTAETYIVYRSPLGVNNPIQIAETNQLFFQDISVEPGGTYTYRVLSKNDCGVSDIGTSNSDEGSVGQLDAPENVSATDGGGACGQIDVTWDVVTFASGYRVYRSDTTDFADALLVGIADSTAFTDVGTTIYPMEYDTPYYYFVQSVNELCQDPEFPLYSPAEVGHSLPFITIPTGVVATLGTSCENIWINWTVGPNDQTYEIYRNQTGVAPDPASDPALETVSLPPYVDTIGAGDSDTYYYWVRANNTCGDSDLSENTAGFAAPDILVSPPTSATQGTGCSEVEITWNQTQSAVIYHIYRNVTDDPATANNIAEGEVITTSPWQDVNALAGQTYFYWVTVENDCGESPKDANGQQGWIGVTVQPSSVEASDDGCNMTTITWSEVPDATRYDVYRNTANDFGTSTWAGFSEVTLFDDAGAAPAVEYYYWVTASSEFCGESTPSSAVTGYSLPGIEIPVNVVASQESLCDEIRLTWDASNQNVVTTYTVYRSPDSDIDNGGPLLPTTTDTTFLDDDPLLVAGIQYYYWVTGTNSCGTSPDSIVATGTAGDGADSPLIVTASDSGLSSFCNQVVITWAASSGANSYMIYRNVVDDAATAGFIDSSDWPMYIDTTASPATIYFYWITSVTSCGESTRDDVDNSDSGSIGQLFPPDDLLASDPDFVGCGSVELTWTPVQYATGYYVYRSTSPTFPGSAVLIGLAEGDTYLDNQFNQSEFNVPLYYWLESVGEYCDAPTTQSPPAEGLSRPPLVAPTTVRSSDGTVCDEVWIDWDEDVNALYFEVWRNTVENSATANLLTDPATAPTTNVYVDIGAFDPDTDYYYWVKTVNTCGTTNFSNSDIGYPADIPGSPIVSVTQGSLCNSIALNWGTIPTANRYQIFRSETVDEEFPQYMAEVITPSTTWVDVEVIPDVDYYYWVSALNDCTTSGTSGEGKLGWIGELAVPTNVQASQQEFCGSVSITWDIVENAANYNIYRKLVDANGDDETLSELIGNSGGTTSFVDSFINPSNQYYYWVKSVNYTICGESDFSSSSIGQSLPPVIVPFEVTATFNEQCGQISVTWVHGESLTTYTVLRNTVDNAVDATIAASGLTDTVYVDIFTDPDNSGVPYFYWIVANNQCGDSNFSQPAALGQAGADPSSPEGLTASPNCNAIILNWSNVNAAATYQLVRLTSPTDPNPTIVYEGDETTHTDSDVVSGNTYYYTVTASNACSTSATSTQVSSTSVGQPPPTGVSATDGTLNCLVSVVWDSVEGATNYKIYRGADADVTNTFQVGQQSQPPFIDIAPLSSAYYFVKAITPDCGEGGFSSGDIGSPFEGLPNPGGVSATNGTVCGGVNVAWDSVSGADSYCVYRSVSEGPQTAVLQACGISGQSWLDDDVSIGTPYWYWVTSESSGNESCNLGIPDQGVSSEALGGIQGLVASQCEPNYIKVEWYGVNSCFDVKRDSTVIATCVQAAYYDLDATGTHNYYVRPRNSCNLPGPWEGPVVGVLTSCPGFDLPDGLLGTEPGDPTILIVPSEINNPNNRKGPITNGTTSGDDGLTVAGDDSFTTAPPWSLCLVGDAEITTAPFLVQDDARWMLPLGGNWRLVGHEGYADLFFLGGSDWEHVRSLRVEEVESGIAQSLLEDGIAAVVGTVPEAGSNVLITGVSPEDCDSDGIPDGCEILLGLARDLNIDGIPDSCAADLNGDGTVDSIDLLEVLQNFGISINMYGDVTGDGVVDQSDVLAVLMEMSN